MAHALDKTHLRDIFRRYLVPNKVINVLYERAIGGAAFLRLDAEGFAEMGITDHLLRQLQRLQYKLRTDPEGFLSESPPENRRAAHKLHKLYEQQGAKPPSPFMIDGYADDPRLLIDSLKKKWPTADLDFLNDWLSVWREKRQQRKKFGRLLDGFHETVKAEKKVGLGYSIITSYATSPRVLYDELLAEYGREYTPKLHWLLAWAEDVEAERERARLQQEQEDAQGSGSSPVASHPPGTPASVPSPGPPPPGVPAPPDDCPAMIAARTKAKMEHMKRTAEAELYQLNRVYSDLKYRWDCDNERRLEVMARLSALEREHNRLLGELRHGHHGGRGRMPTVNEGVQCSLPLPPADEVNDFIAAEREKLGSVKAEIHEKEALRNQLRKVLLAKQEQKCRLNAILDFTNLQTDAARRKGEELLLESARRRTSGRKEPAKAFCADCLSPPPLLLSSRGKRRDTHSRSHPLSNDVFENPTSPSGLRPTFHPKVTL